MNFALGSSLTALCAGPLAAALVGTTLGAYADAAGERFGELRDSARRYAVTTLRLEHRPDEYGAYSDGQVQLYQRLDASVRDRVLLADYQGNVYFQREETGQLAVLACEPHLRFERGLAADWMSHPRREDAVPLASYLELK